MSTPPEPYKTSGKTCCTFAYCYHFDIDQATGIRSAKLDSGPTLGEVRGRLAALQLRLEEQGRSTYANMDEDGDQEIYAFDSGFLAGLRYAINGIDNVRRNL